MWYPYLKIQSKSIERIQRSRRATRLVFKPNKYFELYYNYSERMIFLRLPSLKFRRIRGDLIQVYKIMNGIDNLDWHDFFEKAAVNIIGHSNNKLFVKVSRTNKRKNAFSNRVVRTWNALAEITKSALTLTALKKLLDADPSLNAFTYKYDMIKRGWDVERPIKAYTSPDRLCLCLITVTDTGQSHSDTVSVSVTLAKPKVKANGNGNAFNFYFWWRCSNC